MSITDVTEFSKRYGVEEMPATPTPSPSERVELGNGAGLRTRDHAAIIYWSEQELLRTVVPYLVEGLKAGEKVVYVADDLAVGTVLDALARAGVPVEGSQKSGQLVVVSAKDAFFGNGRFDVEAALQGVKELAREAAAAGFPRVRFSVEMTYLLADVPGIEAGPEFESRANDEVFAQFPFVCICSFNGGRGSSEVLDDVLRTHPVLISNGVPLVNPHYRPWESLQNEKGSRRIAR